MNRRYFFGALLGAVAAALASRPRPRITLRRRPRIVIPASGFKGWHWSKADGQVMYVYHPGEVK